MIGGVSTRDGLVVRLGNDLVSAHHNGANGHFISCRGNSGLFKRRVHPGITTHDAPRTTHGRYAPRTTHGRYARRTTHDARVLGTHRLSRALECERVTVLRAVDTDTIALRVLSLEHRDRERILEQPLNRSLERARPVDGIVALG